MTKNKDILVIGAGLTGIEASLLSAQAGRKVYLIEQTSYFGGSAIKSEEVFPNMECATCMLAPKQSDLLENKNIELINKKVEELFSSLKIDITPSISEKEKSLIILLLMFWDDRYGPRLSSHFPNDKQIPFDLENVGQQLFNAITTLFGNENITKGEGILLNIKNIKKNSFIFFDSYQDDTVRGKERQYMLGLVATKINYFESLKIKEILIEISSKIKQKKHWNIEKYWKKLSTILSGHL